jgi:hypothetical protein
MSNVIPMRPLSDIPAMLRQWADEMESGAEPMPRTVYLVMVADGDAVPDLRQAGQALSRLEEIGALTAAASLPMHMELVPDDG